MKKLTEAQRLAVELSDLWDENEKTMGEYAALHVACAEMGIDPADAMEILSNHPDAVEVGAK